MSNSKDRFSTRVGDYINFRPSYPSESIAYLKQQLVINESTVIADIGSGTGISAKLLLDLGATVYGIEPNMPMRLAAELYLQEYPKFHSINASAEQTMLPDESVEIIVCAQAFHWFMNAACKKEFYRILKQQGAIVLVWNDRKTDDIFQNRYDEIINKYTTDYHQVSHRNISDADLHSFFSNKKIDKQLFSYTQYFDLNGLIGRITSSSYMPNRDAACFPELYNDVAILFKQFERANTIYFNYETRVYIITN